MKVFEIAGPVFTGPSADFAPKMEAPQEELTSAEDVVLSKNGEQAVRDLKLSDQEVELLKAKVDGSKWHCSRNSKDGGDGMEAEANGLARLVVSRIKSK